LATVPAPAAASALVEESGALALSSLGAAASFFSSSLAGAAAFASSLGAASSGLWAWIYLFMAGALAGALWCFWVSTLVAALEE